MGKERIEDCLNILRLLSIVLVGTSVSLSLGIRRSHSFDVKEPQWPCVAAFENYSVVFLAGTSDDNV
jgi:hypothetical protein